MLEQAISKVLPQQQGQESAAKNALHEDAIKASNTASNTASNKNPESKAGSTSPTPQLVPAESANDKRIREESTFFRNLYEKNNVELDPVPKGQGILQSLEQMEKEGKISMSQEQIQAEAKRIQERDSKEPGLKLDGHEKLWSETEIDQMVQADVKMPKGIDVSNWQSSIDWKQVKDAGYQFAFMKATEGTDFVDHTFDEYRKGAREAGLKVGYYHYFHPEEPVDAQVKLFCDVVGKAEPDSLRLFIDAEDPAMWQPFTQQQRAKMVDEFIHGVKNRLGVTPEVGIYCSKEFAAEMLGSAPELKNYSLILADWGPHKPPAPSPWSKWDFWQYTDAGNVPGIKDKVDLDVFNGPDLSLNQVNQSQVKAKTGPTI